MDRAGQMEQAVVAWGDERRRRRATDAERAIRWVRWAAIPYVLVTTNLYRTGASGQAPPIDVPTLGLVIAAMLILTQVPAHLAVASRDVARTRRLGLVTTIADVVGALLLVLVLSSDHDVQLWPILVIPILGSALRHGRVGAVATWAVVAGAYTWNAVRLLQTRPDPASWIANIPYATGLLLLVALGVASLSASWRQSERAIGRWHRRLLTATTELSSLVDVDDTAAMWEQGLEIAARAVGGTDGIVVLPDAESGWWKREFTLGHVDEISQSSPLPDERPSVSREPGGRQVVRLPVGQRGLLFVVGTDLDIGPAHLSLLDLIADNLDVVAATHVTRTAEAASLARLQQLDTQKDDFLSLIAHELRSPMTVINGNAVLLEDFRDQLDDDHQRRLLADIRSGTARLDGLLADAADALKADRTELPVHCSPTDVRPIVAGVAAAVVGTSDLHHLELDIEPGLPAADIDPTRLEQVVRNLVDNAVKYSPDGGAIAVDAALCDGRIELRVQDRGLGIPAAVQSRLFGRFERLHRGLSIPGTGMGLHLTRALVEAMGGTIEVESDAGQGATFIVRLLVADDQPAAERASDHDQLDPSVRARR